MNLCALSLSLSLKLRHRNDSYTVPSLIICRFYVVEDDRVILLEIDLKSPVCDIYPSQHQGVTDNKIRIEFDINLEMHVSHAIAHTFSTTEFPEVQTSLIAHEQEKCYLHYPLNHGVIS